MTARKRPLWTCPRCGHRFVTRNMYHSCVRVRITDHFRGKDPLVRQLYQSFRQMELHVRPGFHVFRDVLQVFLRRVFQHFIALLVNNPDHAVVKVHPVLIVDRPH